MGDKLNIDLRQQPHDVNVAVTGQNSQVETLATIKQHTKITASVLSSACDLKSDIITDYLSNQIQLRLAPIIQWDSSLFARLALTIQLLLI